MWTLLFIMMLTAATIAWFLIQRLQDKPWTEHGVIPASHDAGGFTSSAPKVGLWAFLGVVTSVFLVFTGAYFMRVDTSHGGIASGQMVMWVPLDEPSILWVNTLVLVFASLALEIARQSVNRDNITRTRPLVAAGVVLTIVFIAGQLLAWRQIAATGLIPRESPAFSFFLLLTSVHGLHLLGGLFVLTRAAGRLFRGIDTENLLAVGAIRQSVQLCTTYWHYLLVVWLGLFVMLLST
jgi:cytochrome c oxidase subunit 3